MLYPIEGNPLLPAGLTGPLLEHQAAIAELVLGLRGPDSVIFTAEAAADAARAVAMQVALQNEADPESYLAFSVGRGAETVVYRRELSSGDLVPLHPLALKIVEALYGGLDAGVAPEAPAFPIFGPWR